MRNYLIFSMLLFVSTVFAQSNNQIKYSINDSWIFYKDGAEKPASLADIKKQDVEIVNLPHCFNSLDAIHGATSKTEGFIVVQHGI